MKQPDPRAARLEQNTHDQTQVIEPQGIAIAPAPGGQIFDPPVPPLSGLARTRSTGQCPPQPHTKISKKISGAQDGSESQRYVDRRMAQLRLEAVVAVPIIRSKPPDAKAVEAAAERRREYFRDYGRLRRRTAIGRQQMRASNLRAMHGMTLERYREIYEGQGGRCAICGDAIAMGYDPLRGDGRRGPIAHCAHIDHDHGCCPGRKSCGACVRGLLCGRCNVGIERFRDNPEVMRQAADYVGAGPLSQARRRIAPTGGEG